jgi:CRP/FNR family transcriptional regulator, anaerobic regulatory protein
MALRADASADPASASPAPPDPADRLRAVMERFAAIPDDEWSWFHAHVRTRHFRRGEHLQREGSVIKRMYFILRGSTRTYYLSDGREAIRNFTFENRFAGSTVMTGRVTHVSIQALEPTDTLEFPGDLLPVLYDRHRCWERIGRCVAEKYWLEKEEKELRFRLYSPEEHYRLLVEGRHLMTRRVPLRHLASYLGIAPETLSRIRARIAAAEPGAVA